MDSIVSWVGVIVGVCGVIGILIKIGETKRDIQKNTEDIEIIKKDMGDIVDLNLKINRLDDKVEKNYELADMRFDTIMDKIADWHNSIILRMDRKDEDDRLARKEAEGGRMRAMDTHKEISDNMKLQTELTRQALVSSGIIKPN